MATLQLGNISGVAARGNQPTLLASITAEGANTFTVATVDLPKMYAGRVIDVATKATGVVVASARTITNVTSAGVVTYDGADAATTVAEGVYVTGKSAATGVSNINGGIAPMEGLNYSGNFVTLEAKRARLKVVSSSLYTDAFLNTLTENDIDYALRLADQPQSI